MRVALQGWINNADIARHLRYFAISQIPIELAQLGNRLGDFYISLVGELFQNLNLPDVPGSDWAQLGNAFLQFSVETTEAQLLELGVSREDAALFAATAFYFGDFPASACLAMRQSARPADDTSVRAACFDFLARPPVLQSQMAREIQDELKSGALDRIQARVQASVQADQAALNEGPEQWVVARLLSRLLMRFSQTNIRAVLPQGADPFWTPLIRSLVDRQPSTWEFFPSQAQAIQAGLLSNAESYSMQMPTGAGKTTLCETLLYWHLSIHPDDAAVLLVPFRSLASELRGTLVRRMNNMGLPARCAYGGTVPTGDEIHGLDEVRAIVATPESLSGILSGDPAFSQRISLVICDEGHLLDSGGRGIGLELLLTRLKARHGQPARFVFVSAIVPNIEEVNAWLGGTGQTVVRSTYRPAVAEFAVLRPEGAGAQMSIGLDMHPHESAERRFGIHGFLNVESFRYLNPDTNRSNTYPFGSKKTQAVAAARKLLSMGATAIFAANKRGNQGAVGLTEELVRQLSHRLSLPEPLSFSRQDVLQRCTAYLQTEYGADWIGTQSLLHGAVLHHGDIPQETREVLEGLIRNSDVRLIICTSTLAEGVNLPIRSLVLYSVQRRNMTGFEPMLARDIKNLVGRAGRAGANTKGLVLCANPDQWHLVEPVAVQGAGENVTGSLRKLVELLSRVVASRGIALSNDLLEFNTLTHPLIDGVDSTLIDLISEEVGEEAFIASVRQLSEQTFAARQLTESQTNLLRSVFELRARRLIALRPTGQLAWIRDTGAKVRLLTSVEQHLLPARERWQDPVDPLDDGLRLAILEWAWAHRELKDNIKESFRLADDADPDTVKDVFFGIVRLWMAGATFVEIGQQTQLGMDDLLAIHTRAVTFGLQTLVEQGLSLLARRLQADGNEIAPGVAAFTELLRFGAPNLAARWLASSGVRHRKAYVALGTAITLVGPVLDLTTIKKQARDGLRQHADGWRAQLGELVYANTLQDLANE